MRTGGVKTSEKPVSLIVLSGLHEGVTHAMTAPTLRIGGAGASDLMLGDDGLAPVHVELEAGGGFAMLTALHAGVTVDGYGPVAAGQRRQVRLPATFVVAGVRMRCDGAPPPRAMPASRIAFLMVAVLLTFSGRPAPEGMVSSLNRGPAPASSRPVPGLAGGGADSVRGGVVAASAVSGTAVPALAAPVRAPLMTIEAAAAMLRTELVLAGLPEVRIDAAGATLVASGRIVPASSGRWQTVRETFDRRTGGRIRLNNTVDARLEQAFNLALDSVWTGNSPNIIVGGAKYLEGGVLPNGWTLDRITRDRLMVHRGEIKVEVVF